MQFLRLLVDFLLSQKILACLVPQKRKSTTTTYVIRQPTWLTITVIGTVVHCAVKDLMYGIQIIFTLS